MNSGTTEPCQASAFQLIDYVSSNGLGDVKQTAYKLDDSTKTAVLSIKNDIHHSLARGNATAVVLLDQSASFGRIDHGTLLDCLSSWFGFVGVVSEWLKSYLSDRLQCVKIGSILSDAQMLLFGYLWALFLVQSCVPYILPSSAKSSQCKFPLLCT